MTAEEAIRSLRFLTSYEETPKHPREVFEMAIEALRFKSYFDELYGIGLEVANWHQNGDLISFDGFYEAAMQIGKVIENDNRQSY